MNHEWIARERQLWDAVMMPPGWQRKAAHSVPRKNPAYKSIMNDIEKRKEQDAARAWKAYGDWIRH